MEGIFSDLTPLCRHTLKTARFVPSKISEIRHLYDQERDVNFDPSNMVGLSMGLIYLALPASLISLLRQCALFEAKILQL